MDIFGAEGEEDGECIGDENSPGTKLGIEGEPMGDGSGERSMIFDSA